MLIKLIILFFIGIASGLFVSSGVFAFIAMIGVFPRLAARTNTASAIYQYETWIITGGIVGNLVTIFLISIPIGYIGLVIIGLFFGIYVGCLAMALAEVLNVMPIFVKRVKLKNGMPWIVLTLALGKSVGAWYQLVVK